MMDQDYMDMAGDALSDMRVLVEGAISLFEDYATSLGKLATDAGLLEEKTAMNDIGGAIYSLREHIRHLQSAHMQHVVQFCDIETPKDDI